MLKLRFYGDPILRKISKAVQIGELKEDLLKEMSEIMYTQDGVGLAAPQVGISKRFFLYDIGERLNVVVNPEILEKSKETELGQEGCLSIPNIYEEISRSTWIKVKYEDERGNLFVRELTGYEARVFQHELDHLNGKLFIDYLSLIKRRTLKPQLDEIKEKGEAVLKEKVQSPQGIKSV